VLEMQSPDQLSPEALGDLYHDFGKPRVATVLKLLKLDHVYTRGEGDRLESNGKVILDFLGGYGSNLLGHQPAFLAEEAKRFFSESRPLQTQASIREYTSLLAKKVSDLVGAVTGQSYFTTFTNSGAEAVEAALKHALMEWADRRQKEIWRLERDRARFVSQNVSEEQLIPIDQAISALQDATPQFITLEGSFHGKTAAAVAVTSNPGYKKMYSRPTLETREIARDASAAEIERVFRQADIHPVSSLSKIAGIIFEPIQCEGGMVELSPGLIATLAEQSRAQNIPLIVDEIQTGLGRTGKFLTLDPSLAIPQYVLLGKSLGGGMAKIGAVLVEKSRYIEEFGMVHTSTFAEDDFSSLMALRTLEWLEKNSAKNHGRALEFESAFRKKVGALSSAYPHVIREIRGRGLLLGIEFNFDALSPVSTFFQSIDELGFSGYVFSSYLLNQHQIRVGVSLSQPNTIRLEPSFLIDSDAIEKLGSALEELCILISERKFLRLTRHFWNSELTEAQLNTPSNKKFPPVDPKRASHLRKVGFLTHIINIHSLPRMDKLFAPLPKSELSRFLKKFGPVAEEFRYLEQIIRGANGQEIHLTCYGVVPASDFFEKSLRNRDFTAFEKVQLLANRAAQDGVSHIGLGQYTSIVSENGLMLRKFGQGKTRITTGNSLTAGYAVEAVKKLMREKGIKPEESHIGVVGVTGNICNVLTQIMGDFAREMTLVYKESIDVSPKFRAAVDQVIQNSMIDPSRTHPTDDLTRLSLCDAVIVGTNSATPLLRPEHFKKDAIVLDISVPSNVDPIVYKERPDVTCFQGGFARLPLGQVLQTDWLDLHPGDVYACLGETICTGLVNYPKNLSFGHLSKASVHEALKIAAESGFGLGELRVVRE